MKKNRLLENLSQEIGSQIPMRRYSLADMISESYKAIYDCEDGSNLKRLAEAHLADVKQNPRDVERLSRQMCIIKEMKKLTESGELKDEDLVDKKKYDTVAPNKDRVIVQNECNESADMNASSNREILYQLNKGGMAAEDIESCISHYQPNAKGIDDLDDDTVDRILGYLHRMYSYRIEKYGDDAEIPHEAFELLGLTESKKMRESRAPRRTRRCMNESVGAVGAKVGDTIVDTKTGKEGKVQKLGQSGNYGLIYVDFGNGLRKINPMDDAQRFGRYTLKKGSVNEVDDPELTKEEEEELVKYLDTIRKEKKNGVKTDMSESIEPKRRGIRYHIADSKDPKEELNEEENPAEEKRVYQVSLDIYDPSQEFDPEEYLYTLGIDFDQIGIKLLGSYVTMSWSKEEYEDKVGYDLDESKKIKGKRLKESFTPTGSNYPTFLRDIEEMLRTLLSHWGDYVDQDQLLGVIKDTLPKIWEEYIIESKKSRGKRLKESSGTWSDTESGDKVYKPSNPNNVYSGYVGKSGDKYEAKIISGRTLAVSNDDKKVCDTVEDAMRFVEDRFSEKFPPKANESKSYRGLQNFKKQSEGKAFYKTFKKMNDTLKEGKALTRQESIDLYKAANSALTQMSIELEHNPKFLKTFNEASTLLSADVNSLRESLARGKAPSKNTMRSLAKFSEALLCESEMSDSDNDDRWTYQPAGSTSDEDEWPEHLEFYDDKTGAEYLITKDDKGYVAGDPQSLYYGQGKSVKTFKTKEEAKSYIESLVDSKKVNEAEDLHNDGKYTVYRDDKGDLKCRDRNTGDDVDFDMKELIANGRVKVNEAEDDDLPDDADLSLTDRDRFSEAKEDDEELDDIEAPEDDFVGDDEGDMDLDPSEFDDEDRSYSDEVSGDSVETLTQEYSELMDRIQSKKEELQMEIQSLDSIADPAPQEDIANDMEGDIVPDPESYDDEDIEGELADDDDSDEDDTEITDDELEELKKHLKEMRSARK